MPNLTPLLGQQILPVGETPWFAEAEFAQQGELCPSWPKKGPPATACGPPVELSEASGKSEGVVERRKEGPSAKGAPAHLGPEAWWLPSGKAKGGGGSIPCRQRDPKSCAPPKGGGATLLVEDPGGRRSLGAGSAPSVNTWPAGWPDRVRPTWEGAERPATAGQTWCRPGGLCGSRGVVRPYEHVPSPQVCQQMLKSQVSLPCENHNAVSWERGRGQHLHQQRLQLNP